MDNFHHADGNSITGAILTIVFGAISFTDVEGALKIVAACVAIIAGVTTIYYNIIITILLRSKNIRMKPSKFLKLNWADVTKAAILSGLMMGVDTLYTVFEAGRFPTVEELKVAGAFTFKATLAYLIKNLFDGAKKTETN